MHGVNSFIRCVFKVLFILSFICVLCLSFIDKELHEAHVH